MRLDMFTVITGYTLSVAICTAVLALLWRHAGDRYPGLGYFVADYALQLVFSALLLLRGIIPDFFSIFLANSVAILGMAYLCAGLALFTGKPWTGRAEYSAAALYAAVFFYFSLVQPSLPSRNFLMALFSMGYMYRGLQLLKGADETGGGYFRLAAAAMRGFIAICLVRCAFTVLGHPPHDFYRDQTLDSLLVLLYTSLGSLLAFGIYLMVNRRLLADTLGELEGRIKAEKALVDNAARLDLALESAGMGSWQWDIPGNRRHFDRRTCVMLGLDPEKFRGTAGEFFSVLLPEDAAAVKTALKNTLASGAPYHPEYRTVWPDGSVHNLSARGSLRRGPEGEPLLIDGVVWDVTEKKKAEAELRASEGRFAAAFRSAPVLMSLSEIDTGRYIEVNDKFCEVSGFRREELIGRTSVEIGWISAASRARLLASATGNSLRVPELEMCSKDGRAVICAYACEKILLAGREVLLSIGQDVTSLKKAEQAERTAQKLESLGTLAGGIAHDFNNLLTGITGNISLMKKKLAGEEAELLEEAESACRAARGLARQLLTFASGGEPVKAPLDLAELSSEGVSFSLRGTPVKGRVEGEAGAFVMGDREQLFQVLNNLVTNAAQSMPSGGDLSIRTGRERLGPGAVQGLAAGEYCYLRVRDSGHGISPELLEKIFDPYFSTKGKGRGLGLSVCRSIVLKHGGQIAVCSEQGRGSVFTVYLPPTEARPAKSASAPATGHSGTGRVLVMEDEEIVFRALVRMLEGLGYEATVALRGEEALAAWREAAAAGRPFRAAIMDLTIAGGMGGAEAVKALKALDPSARVVASSGYSDGPVMADYAAHGFDAALSKPYRLEELAAAMEKALG